jgi:hypothetical protein
MLAADFITMARGRFDRARGRLSHFCSWPRSSRFPDVGQVSPQRSSAATPAIAKIHLTHSDRRLVSASTNFTISPVIARYPKRQRHLLPEMVDPPQIRIVSSVVWRHVVLISIDPYTTSRNQRAHCRSQH